MSCLLALGLGAALPAQAQDTQRKTLSIGDYHRILSDPTRTAQENLNIIGWYLIGLDGGLAWLEVSAEKAGIKPLSCPPDGAVSGRDKYINLIAREMERRPDLWPKDSPQPLARLVIAAMRTEFPCR
jgi:hypothetical protein